MWLTSSSVGRKFIMALTGICLVLFVTFHCLMNSVAILWPAAYNVICEFLGANWYALVASMGLALLFIIHIIYAICLTLQNRKARGNDRYAINGAAPGVEWSSKNMLVLGIVVLAFLVVHLINFWSKMQLVEVLGCHDTLPPAAGTLFIQEAFSQIYVPIVYIIGFVALWFHMNHGFWSMFQTIGWDSTVWIPRWKKIGCWWTSIVIALFVIQAVVFTVRANEGFYKTDPALQDQYAKMEAEQLTDIFGEGIAQQANYQAIETLAAQVAQQPMVIAQVTMQNPALNAQEVAEKFISVANFVNYLNAGTDKPQIDTKALEELAKNGMPQMNPMMMGAPAPGPQAQQAPQGQEVEPAPSPEQQAADDAPAMEPAAAENNANNK